MKMTIKISSFFRCGSMGLYLFNQQELWLHCRYKKKSTVF